MFYSFQGVEIPCKLLLDRSFSEGPGSSANIFGFQVTKTFQIVIYVSHGPCPCVLGP